MSDIIGITMGDPAGVGPEICVKALAGMSGADRARTLIYGNRPTLEAAKAAVGCEVDLADRVVDLPVEGAPLPWGRLSPVAGDAAFRFIERAVRDAEAGRIGCIVTAPINKEALNAAGHHYDGHTGMLRSLTGSQAAYMLLASERLKVIHVSTHVSLKDAIARATTERVLATIRAGNAHLKRIGIESPRIAVAGINPHCGENGLFGTEDDDQIGPAVAAARAEGIDASGPISADTVFHRAYNGAFDLVVTDLEMPRIDGFDLLGRMRADPRWERLPVIVATGRDDVEAIDRAFQAGATAFVTKPLNWRLLTYQLKFMLRSARAESALLRARQEAAPAA